MLSPRQRAEIGHSTHDVWDPFQCWIISLDTEGKQGYKDTKDMIYNLHHDDLHQNFHHKPAMGGEARADTDSFHLLVNLWLILGASIFTKGLGVLQGLGSGWLIRILSMVTDDKLTQGNTIYQQYLLARKC